MEKVKQKWEIVRIGDDNSNILSTREYKKASEQLDIRHPEIQLRIWWTEDPTVERDVSVRRVQFGVHFGCLRWDKPGVPVQKPIRH